VEAFEQFLAAPDPVAHRVAVDDDPVAAVEDLLEAVKRQMVAILGDHQIGEQAGGGDRPGNDAILRRHLRGENRSLHRLAARLLGGEGNRPHRPADHQPLEVPGQEMDLLGLLPANDAPLGSRLRAGALALGQVDLDGLLGQVLGEAHPLARLLATGLLEDEGGFGARLLDDRCGLEALEEELELLGVELLALAAEELRLELFELPLGILAAAALFEMPPALFVQQSPAFLDEALALVQRTLERSDLGVELGCGGGGDGLRIRHARHDATGIFVRTPSTSRGLLFRYHRRGCACFKSRPPRSMASCSCGMVAERCEASQSHRNRPDSRRLVQIQSPDPSQSSTLMRLRAALQKTKR